MKIKHRNCSVIFIVGSSIGAFVSCWQTDAARTAQSQTFKSVAIDFMSNRIPSHLENGHVNLFELNKIETTPAQVALGRTVERHDYKTSLAAATNYKEYIKLFLPYAKAGDADAQFYVSQALKYCERDYQRLFVRADRQLSNAEGMQLALSEHESFDHVQAVYDRCHDLEANRTPEIGTAALWLEKASSAGQQQAEAEWAVGLLLQQQVQNQDGLNLNKDLASTNPDIGAPSPIEILRAAVQSRDPQVLFDIGTVQGALNQSLEDKITNNIAWHLVACERGYDCSPTADWVQAICNYNPCSPSATGSDLLRGWASQHAPNAEVRANEISARLDSGQWGELGLGQ